MELRLEGEDGRMLSFSMCALWQAYPSAIHITQFKNYMFFNCHCVQSGHWTHKETFFVHNKTCNKSLKEKILEECRSLKQINSPPYRNIILAFIISAEGRGHFHQGRN